MQRSPGYGTASPVRPALKNAIHCWMDSCREYDVVERHHIAIDAPADVVMAAAREMDVVGALRLRRPFSKGENWSCASDRSRPVCGEVSSRRRCQWDGVCWPSARDAKLSSER